MMESVGCDTQPESAAPAKLNFSNPMQIKEVFERTGAKRDSKARRIVNISKRTARITAEEIENGVTLERLDSIGVPVLRYDTQITIHGRLPAFDANARQGGYKSVVQNSNGSVGVRYGAIDVEKKETIVSASRHADKAHRQWSASLNSTGLNLIANFSDKEQAIAAYRAFPRDLFYGNVSVGMVPMFGYVVLVHVGAIAEGDLWKLIHELYGIASQVDLDALIQAKEDEYEQQRQAYAKAQAAREQRVAEEKRRIAAEINLPRLTQLPQGKCRFVRIADGLSSGVKARTWHLQKRGPVLCYGITAYPSDTQPTKFRKFDALARARVEKDIAAGLVFAL